MDGRIELAEAIALLREELQEARIRGAGEQLQFNVGPVELEFQVEIAREAGASGKVRFWVVEAGADGKLASRSTQVVRISLEPVDGRTGKQLAVAENDRPSRSRASAASE
ncbi:hypothetical protein OHA21_05175 [Actinoplanes sp. NBC_00393]|uniref:trypco2 family protein n=1 Tax=Actinoplanes sp. NBC_00393 TaxID=2975953 RepID=UPI002E1D78DD